MIRATAWTVGLFGAGTALCRVFPAPWLEPLVLLALGVAFLFVSARVGTGPRRTARVARAGGIAKARVAAAPAAAPATASVQVEQSA